jgi:Replicative DNA helicase
MKYYDADVEQVVIGCLVTHYDECKHAVPSLESNDFYFCGDLFQAIKEQYINHAVDIDLATILFNLPEHEKPEFKSKVLTCINSVVTVRVFDDHVARLKQLSQLRRINDKLQSLVFYGFNSLKEIEQVVEEEKANAIVDGAVEKSNKAFEDYIVNVGTVKPTVKTGLPTVDRVLGGIRYGTVCHIGARPSSGKTAFALNIARQQKERVVIFSLEMSSEMIYERWACSITKIDYGKFSRQRLNEAEIQQVKNVMSDVKAKNNVFVFDDIYSIEQIGDVINEVKPRVVIIDYIQKVTSTQKFIGTRERIDYISGELKRIAKSENDVIIALSQLSRDGKDAPTMSSLKESGALEADGDYIMLIHRPYVLNKKTLRLSLKQQSC